MMMARHYSDGLNSPLDAMFKRGVIADNLDINEELRTDGIADVY
jgi:hypothetical protein